jgi:hypothetical protein
MTIENEEWRQVPGSPWYEVSNLGRARSIDRVITYRDGRSQFWPGKILTPSPNADGYPKIALSGRTRNLHVLVALAFIGPCPEGREINHKDGNKLNAAADNLEYVSHQENIDHAGASGLQRRALGEASGNCKLTEQRVREIRALKASGRGVTRIARDMGVGLSCVRHVLSGRTWRHVA